MDCNEASPEAHRTGSAKGISVADVIARLADLKPPRGGEMVSALRTACRVLNAEPSSVSAEPSSLRRRLEVAAYGTAGIRRGRWNNVRSLTLNALKVAGLRTMPGRSSEPLTQAWKDLRASLPDVPSRHRLSRFISFCSSQQLPPEAVNRITGLRRSCV